MKSEILFGPAADLLPTLLPQGRIVALVDRRVAKLYPGLIRGWEYLLVDAAERNKTLKTADKLYKELMHRGADRSTFLLGIGGGITTDLTGFVAATYLRGLRFGFVPTTLLAQVDAAIGGKNGVNVDRYKNMVGTIRQPEFVLCDPALLQTLPDRYLRAGLAEAVKAAIVGDPALFEYLENKAPFSLLHDPFVMERALAVKMKIVQADEHESGERRLLNLGHTLGHALEKCTSRLNHGEAVAIGMAMIAKASSKENLLPATDCNRIVNTLRRLGLPTESPVPTTKLLQAAARDKKNDADKIHIVLPVSIGHCETRPMTLVELASLL